MKDMVTWVIVELTSPKGDHIPHEQEYNTRHGISAIPNEVCGEIRRQPRQPEVQQEPVVHLLLEEPLGRHARVIGLLVPAATPPSQPAHTGGAEADPGHAPQESKAGHGGTVAPAVSTRIHPPSGKPVPGDEKAGPVSAERKETSL